jgi:hypothetical protein
MTQDNNLIDIDTKESKSNSFGKSVLVFFGTPLIYYFWFVMIDSAPAITIDLTVMNNETIIFILSFWVISILYFILAFLLMYLPLFKFHSKQNDLNKIQAHNLIFSSVFSVFFCLAIWYWHRFIFESKSFTQAIEGIFTFSILILGVFGVIQFWFSVIALQVVMWIKSLKA